MKEKFFKILRVSNKIFGRCIGYFEKKIIIKNTKADIFYENPIFIVGAPRSGSTILYQMITNYLDVSYIDNLICAINRNFYLGFLLSNLIYKDKPHNCYKSKHGRTVQTGGLHAPSECGSFWYRWLPKNKHYVAENEISIKELEEIKANINAVMNKYRKPLIFKNLNAGQRMEMIHEIFPNAKFIFIKREKLYNVQSIICAKKKLNMKLNEWWSIMPPNVDELKKINDGYEQITKQVYFLEKKILQDKKLFPDENFIEINYEDLVNKPDKIISEIKKIIGEEVSFRKNFQKIRLKDGNKITLDKKEIDIIKEHIGNIYREEKNFES